ncbi:hypothetical protein GC173_05415 [bacterium]|nr:hypothetical protein [bacterium]
MNRHRRGLTLLECLVYTALISLLTVFTMEAMGRARLLQGNAHDRLALATRAQEELDKLQSTRPAVPSDPVRTENPWGPRTYLETTVADGPLPDSLLVRVEAGRVTYDRPIVVKLETLVRRPKS